MFSQKNFLKNIQEYQLFKYISFCIIIYCIIIRCYYYAQSKFIWLDEAWLFFSLYDSDFINVFTQNNNFFQTYPSFFGVISLVNIKLFGISLYSLRLLPFFCSCAFFILIYFVAKKIKDTKYAAICLSISSFNVILLNYCDEFKQYSLEADITLILLLYYQYNKNLTAIQYKFIFLSACAILLSVPAPFVILTIIFCFYSNYLKSKSKINLLLKTFLFFKKNFWQLFVLALFSFVYFYFCLKNGDANNGNAWESGMIPYDYRKILEWFINNFIVILSRLMSNSHRVFEGAIFLIFSFFGMLLLAKSNSAFSKIIKFFVPIFILSLCHVYSLGNVFWGTQGARLSIYALPIFILSSGYFIYFISSNTKNNKHKLLKDKQLLKKIIKSYEHIQEKNIISIVFIVLCIYMSIFSIICMNEWHYKNNKDCSEIINVLEKNKKNIIIAHSSIWYSLQYCLINKKLSFKINKLGNEMTPTSEYPPISCAFTSCFTDFASKLGKNNKIFIFVQQFHKDKILRFVENCGLATEIFNCGEFYILTCQK